MPHPSPVTVSQSSMQSSYIDLLHIKQNMDYFYLPTLNSFFRSDSFSKLNATFCKNYNLQILEHQGYFV